MRQKNSPARRMRWVSLALLAGGGVALDTCTGVLDTIALAFQIVNVWV